MSEKKGLSPLAVGLGVVLGAAGALFLSKKENREKVKKAVKSLKKEKSQGLLTKVNRLMDDVGKLSDQKGLDKKKK